jgi:hypothetical protein
MLLDDAIALDDFGNLPLLEDSCATQKDAARPTAIAEDMSLFNIVNIRGLLFFYLGRDIIKNIQELTKTIQKSYPLPAQIGIFRFGIFGRDDNAG